MGPKKKLSLVGALGWIIGSSLVISGTTYSGFKWYLEKDLNKDKVYELTSIVQTGPQKEALKTIYLGQLLNLSIDRPISSRNFDLRAAKEKLESSPVIKQAHVELLNPSTLYIDYTIRQPIAMLYNYENTLIDKEGYLFPLIPFFAPKNLPEIYLSAFSHPFNWKTPVAGKELELAFHLLTLLSDPKIRDLFHVHWIDVSSAFADSYGKREIVLVLEDEILHKQKEKEYRVVFPRLLRLSTKNYSQEIGDYLKLREQLLQKEAAQLFIPEEAPSLFKAGAKIIDLRLSKLAFIEEK